MVCDRIWKKMAGLSCVCIVSRQFVAKQSKIQVAQAFKENIRKDQLSMAHIILFIMAIIQRPV